MNLYIHKIFAITPQPLLENCFAFSNNYSFNEIHSHVSNAIEPDYSRLIHINGQRRMCRLVKMGVYSALSCFNEATKTGLDAIIVGNGLSIFDKTATFLESILTKQEKGIPPTPFTQSLHSAIAGQIALELQFNGYVTTYSQNAFAFENALSDSFLLAEEGASNILIGALDEAPIQYRTIYEKLGRVKPYADVPLQESTSSGILLGEGCVFMHLTTTKSDSSLTYIKGIKHTYNTKNHNDVVVKIHEILTDFHLTENDIDIVFWGNTGDSILDKTICSVQANVFTTNQQVFFKNFCGEYPTASSYAVWMATVLLNNKTSIYLEKHNSIKHVIIINHYNDLYYSIILLGHG